MERRIATVLPVLYAVLFSTVLLIGCSDATGVAIDEDNNIYLAGPVLELPEISPSDGSTITAHEIITIRFPSTMPVDSLIVGGDFAGADVLWDTQNLENDTLILNSQAEVSWLAGDDRSLQITIEGYDEMISYAFEVFNGMCVSDPLNVVNPGSSGSNGTSLDPLATVQAGITKAVELYIFEPGDTAEIHITAGNFEVACNTTTPTYAAEMEEGVSLYGGYSSNFKERDVDTNVTRITDTSSTGGSEFDPVTAIYCDSEITTSTAIDGLTITLGKEDGSHSAIYCEDGSPTIRDVIIQGRPEGEKNLVSHGILLKGSSAFIENCTIDPGWSGVYSTGVYCIQASFPTVTGNTISGGFSDDSTYGVRTETGSDSIITNNTISGGDWDTIAGTEGRCIRVRNCNPTISGNTFNWASTLHWETCAIYEATVTSNPASVTQNDFNYDGNWYYDSDNTTMITKANYDTPVTTGDGEENLFNPAGWDNYSTSEGINVP